MMTYDENDYGDDGDDAWSEDDRADAEMERRWFEEHLRREHKLGWGLDEKE